MKVNDTVKVVKGSKTGLIGKITDIGNTTVEVYFESLKDSKVVDPYFRFMSFDYLEVINESRIRNFRRW